MTEGSANREGYLYHEPAFPVEKKQYHRNDNRERLDVLLTAQDWWNREVLDVGCNVGYFTIHLALEGARVTGIDVDEDALQVGLMQAKDYGVEGAFFMPPTDDRRYTKSKDVVLAFSVLPWIYKTEPDPEACINDLFKAPIAYVEIPYPPDGRANVPGVSSDEQAKAYLERWYPSVVKIATAHDDTDGVKRERSIFKCMRDVDGNVRSFVGSQAIVDFDENAVRKTRREGKIYDPIREATFLDRVAKYDIAPKVLTVKEDELIMTRIHGVAIGSKKARETYAFISDELTRIERALTQEGISHNDIRPANLILGNDGRLYVVDFGWATWANEDRPKDVNPEYGGGDRVSFEKIGENFKRWG